MNLIPGELYKLRLTQEFKCSPGERILLNKGVYVLFIERTNNMKYKKYKFLHEGHIIYWVPGPEKPLLSDLFERVK